MFPNFRHTMAWLHTWFGLVLGFVLMAAFFFGALSVFDREIDRWAIPSTRFEPQPMPSYEKILRPAFERMQPLLHQQWVHMCSACLVCPPGHVVVLLPATLYYSKFGPQSRLVLERSGKMTRRYGELYHQLSRWVANGGDPAHITQYGISLAQLGGADRMGNVLFTGYYSPVLEVRHRPDAKYKYPIYAMPKCGGRCPSRAEIHQGALANRGLELGYSKSLIDNFLMEAIDQPWKVDVEGWAGPYWGMYNADREPKYALEGVVERDPHWSQKASNAAALAFIPMMLAAFFLPGWSIFGRFFLAALIGALRSPEPVIRYWAAVAALRSTRSSLRSPLLRWSCSRSVRSCRSTTPTTGCTSCLVWP